jgi:uncharacterized PurR-regulated membrane protein YhhQ (DUF165 family)
MVARRLRDSFLASLLLVLAELFGCLVLAGLVYVASMLTVFDIDTAAFDWRRAGATVLAVALLAMVLSAALHLLNRWWFRSDPAWTSLGRWIAPAVGGCIVSAGTLGAAQIGFGPLWI